MIVRSVPSERLRVDADIPIDLGRLAAAHDASAVYAPVAVKIQLVDGCDASCRMCNHWRRKLRSRALLGTEFLAALLADLQRLGTRVVRFTGGEPTLRKDLDAIIASATDAGIVSELNSHAMRIDDALARRLQRAGLERICVSMHSHREALHDFVFNVEGAWKRAWGGIRAIRRASSSMRVRLHTVIMKATCPGVSGLPQMAADNGVDEIHLQEIEVAHLKAARDRMQALLPEEAADFNREVLPRFLDDCRAHGIRTNIGSASSSPIVGVGQPSPQRCCYRPNYHLLILENGEVYPCSELAGEEDLLLGNVLSTPIQAIVDGPGHRRILSMLSGGHPICDHCTWQLKRNQKIAERLE